MPIRNGIEITDKDAAEYDRLTTEAEYYDRLQYVYKIKLNSLYGALTNFHFRFFDLRLGQSTTGSGRAILDHMCSHTALVLDGKYDMFSESIAYGDSVGGDSILYRDDNTNIKIEDMFESIDNTIGSKEYHHPTDMNVLTYDESTNKSCYKPVKYVMRHKASKQMYRVWLSNDTYIDVTEDHSLMGYTKPDDQSTDSCLYEVKPNDFNIDNDQVVYLKSRPRATINSKQLQSAMYELLGIIAARGTIKSGGVLLALDSVNKQRIINIFINHFVGSNLIDDINHDKNGNDIFLVGSSFADTCAELLGGGGVPSWMRDETSINICSFVRGYYATNSKTTVESAVIWSNRMEDLVRMQELLSYCGVGAIRSIGQDTPILTIKSVHTMNDVVARTGVYATDHGLDFEPSSIVKIEELDFDDYVYDVEIEDTHTFFANNVLVHNTDSVYFRTNAEVGAEGLSPDEMRIRATKIADYIGEVADASFDEFCEKAFCIQPNFRNIIKCDREVVAKRGIFVSKKRYVLKLVDLDGYVCNKIKAMGLEMKKTTTPKNIQRFLEEVVNMILDGDAAWPDIDDYIIGYRDRVVSTDPVLDIGLPKGVKKVEFYTNLYEDEKRGGEKARLPGHVAASIHYNECLVRYGDKTNEPIRSGAKIKVFYLTKVMGKFKSIALPTDMEKVPFWFDEHCSVLRTRHEHNLIDKNLEKIFNAISREVPTAQSKFNNALVEW